VTPPGSGIHGVTGLRRGEMALDHEEQDLVSQEFPLPEVERMIRDGEIKDATGPVVRANPPAESLELRPSPLEYHMRQRVKTVIPRRRTL
jgi:hypothetical protein